jgi:rhodanese-related sulfurtransferase
MTYAGDVTPQEAYAAVCRGGDAVLVDVRTRAEWTYVGVPALAGPARPALFVEWQRWPDGTVNARFVDELRQAGVGPGTAVYFLCRSGVRSRAAAEAASEAGLGPAYNVTDGFEGPHDDLGHRSLAGWKNDGLPWRQG